MQDLADACQVESKNTSPAVTVIFTQEDESSESVKCTETLEDPTNTRPISNDSLNLLEGSVKSSEESDEKVEKVLDIDSVKNKNEENITERKIESETHIETKESLTDAKEDISEAAEMQTEIKDKKLHKNGDEKQIEIKNENLDLCEKKDDILPSLGILPDVESSIGANASHPKCVRLPQIADSSTSTAVNDPSEVSHKVKRIKWKDSEVPIITQNNNGPCPLLAILNAMILKGKITLPRDRQELTGGELVSIVGNAVFDVPRSSVPSEMHSYLEQNTQDAVSILHKLLTGLDVNVKFSGVKDFEFTSELSIFDVLEVSLYHGWVVDPSSEPASLVSNLSYNQLTNNIIMWRDQATSMKDDNLLLKAILCEEFICNSVSQLTIHGLFELGAALADEEIAVFFRNNHFSTIYKKNDQLYQLLTDQGFLMESVVWETLTDIDANFSVFVNGAFQPIPQECASEDITNMTKEQQINSDHQLAAMLQQEAEKQQRREEDFNKIVEDLGLHNLSDEEIARRLQNRENQLAEEANRSSAQAPEERNEPDGPYNQSQLPTGNQQKRKKDCTIL